MPTTTDPNAMAAFAVLLTALGLSGISGLRAYLPLLGVAAGADLIPGTQDGHLVKLAPWLQHLNTSWTIALLVVLALGEFTVDKVPVLDHVSDVLHTVIRPLSGAIIMAGTDNPLSHVNPIAAGIVGAALALTVHSAKAAVRPVSTATTAGLGNPIISFIEDIFTIVVSALALFAPVIGAILFGLVAFFVGRLIIRGVRGLRGRRARQQVPPIPPVPVLPNSYQ
jgi:hypothetical protein